jgi:hypothetical protein
VAIRRHLRSTVAAAMMAAAATAAAVAAALHQSDCSDGESV